MKIKELQKIVNITWSPAQQNTIYLAAGTAGQQLDSSGTSNLEIYSVNLEDPSYDMILKGSQINPYRFHKLIWSPIGIGGNQYPNGIIVGGCEGGHLQLFNANKLLAANDDGNEPDALISQQDQHTGPVRSLDYNPFQMNLLASGASESEILIWDLNNPVTPMTPGTKTQPFEDIQNVAWNKQVQHILASVYSTKCVIWDLRKNEPIIKLSDTQSRVRWHAIQWHPEIATQLWLASEDDHEPVVQLWDLRYATAPTKSLQIHQRGILGLAWCTKDIDLMISCGKDNKIICWNPNVEFAGDELCSEVASTIQWYSDVMWCPKNPAIIASSSLEGNVSIYSLYGGCHQQVQTTNKIADSFPGMDTFAQAPVPQNVTQVVYSDLKVPPKWMKRPIGATFGFGGKLITFQNSGGTTYSVNINQVITEPTLIDRSNKLEDVLSKGNFIDYCRYRADQMPDQHGRYVWYFLKANFEENSRAEMLNLLGYKSEDVQCKFQKVTENNNENVIQLTNKMAELSRVDDNNTAFDSVTNNVVSNKTAKTNDKNEDDDIPFDIRVNDEIDGLICQALITGNIESAVELCMNSNRTTDAIIIAMSGGSELLARTQYRYLKQSKGYLSHIISALVTEDWMGVIEQCTIDSWKEALCATLTHSDGNNQMFVLCEKLGERLQMEIVGAKKNITPLQNAILCYICAGNIEKLVDAWLTLNSINGTNTYQSNKLLQDLVEIIILFQKSMELKGKNVNTIGKTANLLSHYAQLLATQGELSSALTYLGPSEDNNIVDLRERLYYALGHKQQQQQQQQQQQYRQQQQQHQQRQSLGGFHQQQQQPNKQTNLYARSSSITNSNMSVSQQQPLNASTMATQPPPPPPLFNTGLPGQKVHTDWNNLTSSQQNSNIWNNPMPSTLPPLPQTIQPPLIPQQNQSLSTMQQQTPANVGLPPSLAQPPRPSSVGSQGSLPTKNKYLLDPSVQSNYGNQNSYLPSSGQMTNNKIMPSFNTQSFGQQPLQQQPSSIMQNTVASYNHNQQQQQQTPLPPQSNFNDTQRFNTFSPAPHITNNMNNNYLPGVPSIEVAQQAIQYQQQQQQQRNPTPPPGWNDPPAVKNSRQAPKTELNNMNAITHPLFGQDPNPIPNNSYYDHNANIQYDQQSTMNQLQPPPPRPPSSASTIQQPFSNNINYQQQSQQQQVQQPTQQFQQPQQQQQQMQSSPTPPPIKQKAALPEEFVYMQTLLNELRTQCINAASNPQSKRKLDDVGKRLECLYDLLRENRLSTNTLTSLNQLVQLVQIGDYTNGLGLHTQMVSGQDFSQIASFMPGIKVLLQSAMQLQVYLR